MSFASRTISLLALTLIMGLSFQARAEEQANFPVQAQIQARQIHATHSFCNLRCFEMKQEIAKAQAAAAPAEDMVAAPILFGNASDKLTKKAMGEIKKVAAIIKSPAFKDRHVFVKGYTDNKGKEASNLKLSSKRSTMVMKQLVKLGVPAAQLSAEGFGSKDPVADNKTKAGRAQNRRVTFTALAKK